MWKIYLLLYLFPVHLLFEDFCSGLSLALNHLIILQRCIWIWFPEVLKSSPESYDPLDSQMKFPPKAERGIPPKEPPTQSQTLTQWVRIRAGLWVRFRVWIRVRIFPRRNFPVHFLLQRRRFLRGFTARVNLCRRIRLYRILIRWRSTTLLIKRHARIFWNGCSHREIIAKHVPSFETFQCHLHFLCH